MLISGSSSHALDEIPSPSSSSVDEWMQMPMEKIPEGVDTSDNRIAGNRARLKELMQEWYHLEQGESSLPVSILQIGDSHTQAGFNTARTRTRLQGCFGDAGLGLIAPLRLSGTNEPTDYQITSPNRWVASRCIERLPEEAPGVTGMALATPDNHVQFQITAKEEPFNRIRIFHHAEAPLLHAPDSLSGEFFCPMDDTEESTLIALNESVTTLSLEGKLVDPHYAHPAFYGFSLENGNRGILYHGMGINGNTFTAMNRNPQILRQAALLTPQLLVLALGTNDSYGRNFSSAELDAQIEHTLKLCENYLPGVPILLMTPIECSTRLRGRAPRPNPNSEKVRDAIIRAAEHHALPYWDFWQIAGGEGAIARWDQTGLSNSDRIHLTREGYQLQGELLARALLKLYRDYVHTGTL